MNSKLKAGISVGVMSAVLVTSFGLFDYSMANSSVEDSSVSSKQVGALVGNAGKNATGVDRYSFGRPVSLASDRYLSDSITSKTNPVWNNELERYVADGVLVRSGEVRIDTFKTVKNHHSEFLSGKVTTEGKFDFEYGMLDMDLRLPVGSGVFPAVWLRSVNNQVFPEVDIMEDPIGSYGESKLFQTLYGTYHYLGGAHSRQYEASHVFRIVSNDIHVKLIWTPHELDWIYEANGKVDSFRVGFAPHEKMYLVLNTAVGGAWPGSPWKTKFPESFEILNLTYSPLVITKS